MAKKMIVEEIELNKGDTFSAKRPDDKSRVSFVVIFTNETCVVGESKSNSEDVILLTEYRDEFSKYQVKKE